MVLTFLTVGMIFRRSKAPTQSTLPPRPSRFYQSCPGPFIWCSKVTEWFMDLHSHPGSCPARGNCRYGCWSLEARGIRRQKSPCVLNMQRCSLSLALLASLDVMRNFFEIRKFPPYLFFSCHSSLFPASLQLQNSDYNCSILP